MVFFVLMSSSVFDVYSMTCDAGYEFLSGSPVDTYVLLAQWTVYKFSYDGSRTVSGSWNVIAGTDWTPGSTDGIGTNAKFFAPSLVAVLPGTMDSVIVHDSSYKTLRRVNVTSRSVTTFLRSVTVLNISSSLTQGGSFYIVRNYLANVSYPALNISEVYESSRWIPALPYFLPDGSVAPNGTGKMYQTNIPTLSPDGTFFIITDAYYHSIRLLDLSTSNITTLAGSNRWYTNGGVSPVVNAGCQNGVGRNAEFNYPTGAAIGSGRTLVYIADYNNRAIRVMNLSNLTVSNVAGSCPSTAVATVGGFMASIIVKNMVLSPDETYLFVLTPIGFAKVELNTRWVYYVFESPNTGQSSGVSTWWNFAQMPRAVDRCSACTQGTFSGGGISCVSCPAGYFCNITSSFACLPGMFSIHSISEHAAFQKKILSTL